MKILIITFLSVLLMSCSHHHKTPEHHHHGYEKQCAYSVAHGDFKTKGKEEFKVVHGGKNYYFSTKQKLDEFKESIESNIKEADYNWRERRTNIR